MIENWVGGEKITLKASIYLKDEYECHFFSHASQKKKDNSGKHDQPISMNSDM